jgi:hypothetical protein
MIRKENSPPQEERRKKRISETFSEKNPVGRELFY